MSCNSFDFGIEVYFFWVMLIYVFECGMFLVIECMVCKRNRDWYIDVYYVDINLVGKFMCCVVVLCEDCYIVFVLMLRR